jgi:hypothetical protein
VYFIGWNFNSRDSAFWYTCQLCVWLIYIIYWKTDIWTLIHSELKFRNKKQFCINLDLHVYNTICWFLVLSFKLLALFLFEWVMWKIIRMDNITDSRVNKFLSSYRHNEISNCYRILCKMYHNLRIDNFTEPKDQDGNMWIKRSVRNFFASKYS